VVVNDGIIARGQAVPTPTNGVTPTECHERRRRSDRSRCPPTTNPQRG
jgi:hypothetical protein